MCYIDLRLEIYEPNSLKLGMLADVNDHYILIPVWVTLTFICKSSLWKSQNTCNHFAAKWSEIAKNLQRLLI